MASRLAEKLKAAGAVAARQHTKIEARADAIIARESDIERRTDKAFMPHESILSDQEQGLDELERSLAVLTNGAPPDPLPATGSTPPAAPEPLAGLTVHPVIVNRDGSVVG